MFIHIPNNPTPTPHIHSRRAHIPLYPSSRSPHAPHPPLQAAPAAKPQAIFRKDYTPPPYMIDTVHLNFNLNEEVTHVTSKLVWSGTEQ